jgi:hypothetical protein
MAPVDLERAHERIKKLIIVGDNRLKQGGDDKYQKARGTFLQALRLAQDVGLEERFGPLIERRLQSIEALGASGQEVEGE